MSSIDPILALIRTEYDLPAQGIAEEVDGVTGALFKARLDGERDVWVRLGGVANRTEHEVELEGQCASRVTTRGIPVSPAIAD